MEKLRQVSHYPRETTTRIDSYLAREFFLTQTQMTNNCYQRSPLVQLKNHGSDQRHTLRESNLPG
jgi:hypothetical protein